VIQQELATQNLDGTSTTEGESNLSHLPDLPHGECDRSGSEQEAREEFEEAGLLHLKYLLRAGRRFPVSGGDRIGEGNEEDDKVLRSASLWVCRGLRLVRF